MPKDESEPAKISNNSRRLNKARNIVRWDSESCNKIKLAIVNSKNIKEDALLTDAEFANVAGLTPKCIMRHGGMMAFLIAWEERTKRNIDYNYNNRKQYSGAEKCTRVFLNYVKEDPYIFMYIVRQKNIDLLFKIAEIFKNEVSDEKYELFCLNLYYKLYKWCTKCNKQSIGKICKEKNIDTLWGLVLNNR